MRFTNALKIRREQTMLRRVVGRITWKHFKAIHVAAEAKVRDTKSALRPQFKFAVSMMNLTPRAQEARGIHPGAECGCYFSKQALY